MIPITPTDTATAKAFYDAVTAACLYITHEPMRDSVLAELVATQTIIRQPLMVATTNYDRREHETPQTITRDSFRPV